MDDLGDRMPSALMDEMLSLLDACMLSEQLFLNRMPDAICLQLTDPCKVVEQADQLWLSLNHNSSCSSN